MIPEEKILGFIGAHEGGLLQLTRDLVATPSPTPPGDERAVAERIRCECHALQLGSPETLAARDERPNLLIRVKGGRSGRTLILNGHMDTKPVGNRSEWKTDPFDPAIRDGKVYGLGSTDMKGAVAAMVYAGAALGEVRESFAGELQLLLTADEEGGSAFGVKFLASAGHVHGDAALIGEPSGVRRELEFIDLSSRGIACFRFQVHGDQMHSSLSDEFQAVNASVKAARLLSRFAREFKLDGTTVNAGVTLRGGVSFGVVPGFAEFGCDLRVPPGSSEGKVRAQVEAWLAQQRLNDPELRVELLWQAPPTPWIEPVHFPEDHRLAQALRAACAKVLVKAPSLGCFPAATDAPWFVAVGVPTIPAFGPGLLPLAHAPNECVEIASVFACARIYALTALHYLT
jgi:acetylornithine deacetylase